MYDFWKIVVLGVILVVFIGYFLLRLWSRTGHMSIRHETVYCPNCRLKAPLLRKAKNFRELFFGGWTCEGCDCEFDRYGNKISNIKLNG